MNREDKAKHTAGPWVARITPWGIDIHTDDDKSFGICDLGTRSQLEDADYPFEEASANARLIAASPEMYEMLKSCLAFVDVLDLHGIVDNWSDRPKLVELIKKIEG